MRRLAAVCLAAAAAGCSAPGPLLSAPYKDVSQALDPATLRVPLAGVGRALVWAFATGECGQERWGEFDTDRFAAANVRAFVDAGIDYVISTGGEAGAFTCASAEGMQRFLARYDSPRLLGLDFDIERQQTPAQIDALARRAAELQRSRPALRLSFTLATHASPDGSQRSLNALGERVLASLREHGVERYVVNLMVMNYGPADLRWCVLRADGAACDMGRSALQAAHNVHRKYGLPYERIALTPMLGENDVAGNVFTPADAELLARGARELKLAAVHWWSLGRDRACEAGSPRVSPSCHGLADLPPGRFGTLLGAAAQ
jgi:chitinase